jgi:glutathione S-transferase
VFDNGDVIFDSPEIAKYLDEKYPSSQLDPSNAKLDELINDYNTKIAPGAILNAFDDLFALLDPENQACFRLSREKIFGKKLEEISGNRGINTIKFIQNIAEIDGFLLNSKFLNGNKPLIHDYTLASRIQYFRTVSPRTYNELILNGPNINLLRWVRDMDKLFDNYLKNRKTASYD